MAFSVKLDLTSLARSSRGAITGVLFLEVDGFGYPELGWNDFPVIILAWWARAVRDLRASGVGAEAVCRFMDGPFSFSLRALSYGEWEVRLLGKNGELLRTAKTTPGEVVRAIQVAAAAVLQACADRGWGSRETEELQAAIRS
jgi:hypothetical protein